MLNFKEYPRNGSGNSAIENGGEMHLPCVVLVDTSSSMSRDRAQLHQGLIELGEALDEQARGRVEFCIIGFDDDARVLVPFGPAYDYEAPDIECKGMTAMHSAVECALNELEIRKNQYKENKTSYYRPWIYMLTDGGANDADNGAFDRLVQSQKDKRCIFFPVAIGEDADKELLKSLNEDGVVLKASRENFKNSFVYLSNSISLASVSESGTKVTLPNPNDYQLEVEI